MTSRRGFLIGIGAALAAPAIVKAESLMKIAQLRESLSAPIQPLPYVDVSAEIRELFDWLSRIPGAVVVPYEEMEDIYGQSS